MFEQAQPRQAYVSGDEPDNWDVALIFKGKDADKMTVKDRMEIAGYARDVMQRRLDSEEKKSIILVPYPILMSRKEKRV